MYSQEINIQKQRKANSTVTTLKEKYIVKIVIPFAPVKALVKVQTM